MAQDLADPDHSHRYLEVAEYPDNHIDLRQGSIEGVEQGASLAHSWVMYASLDTLFEPQIPMVIGTPVIGPS